MMQTWNEWLTHWDISFHCGGGSSSCANATTTWTTVDTNAFPKSQFSQTSPFSLRLLVLHFLHHHFLSCFSGEKKGEKFFKKCTHRHTHTRNRRKRTTEEETLINLSLIPCASLNLPLYCYRCRNTCIYTQA